VPTATLPRNVTRSELVEAHELTRSVLLCKLRELRELRRELVTTRAERDAARRTVHMLTGL
jgi:hypothetical protein